MDLVLSTIDGREYSAAQFADSPHRDALRSGLICLGCRADAYFIRRARNGRPACFGARPHNLGCKLGADGTELRTTHHLEDAERREPAEGEYTLQPMRRDPIVHAQPDDTADEGSAARGRRHVLPYVGGRSLPNRNLSRLLRELVRDPSYRNSTDVLHMDDGTSTTVRDWCIHTTEVELQHRFLKRLYWGTVRYVAHDRGAYWLNSGRGASPTVVLQPDGMEQLLRRKRVDEIEDLQGSAFITHSKLGYRESDKRFFLHVDDLDWFTVRLPHQDPEY